jgi:hypothetical protein
MKPLAPLLVSLTSIVLATSVACAQQTVAEAEPPQRVIDKDVPFVPSPEAVVDKMLPSASRRARRTRAKRA